MSNIVLVEDDLDDIYFFKRACQGISDDITITTLSNGKELIDYVNTQGVLNKIFFIDLNMPKVGGLEALSKIKSAQHFEQMISIIYTTSARDKDIVKSYELGAKSYLLKPDSLSKIQELIQSTIKYWTVNNTCLMEG